MLDHPIDVKPFLHRKSKKLNISQELDFIPADKPHQKLFLPPAAKGLTTKATPADKQKRTALPTKDP